MASHSTRSANSSSGTILHETTYTGSESLSAAVLDALDALPDFDATSSDARLADQIDPDALDSLFQSTSIADRTAGSVTFPIQGYEVSVDASGEIAIRSSQS